MAAVALALALGGGESRVRAGAAETLGDAYRAYLAGDYPRAARLAAKLEDGALKNPDYARFVRAQSAFLLGQWERARIEFEHLATMNASRFASTARWRIADCLWEQGKKTEAADVYRRLVGHGGDDYDHGLARFRLAAAAASEGRKDAAIAAFKSFRLRHPLHPLEPEAARRLRQLGGAEAAQLDPAERISRAQTMRANRDWRPALVELRGIPDDAGEDLVRRRDYEIGMTLFHMRRRYEDAGRILLRIYPKMGALSDDALFHGARALSRADLDKEAIRWYQKLVASRPRSRWAAEAQFLSGWLEFNLKNYREAIPYLEKTASRYRRTKWGPKARWYLGFSHFMLGEHKKALPYFERLAKRSGRLVGGKGRYWRARTLWLMGKKSEANKAYRALVTDYPFSWYALLSRARLARQGIDIGPFGDRADSGSAPPIAPKVPEALASDPLIAGADELIAAGLGAEAGIEMRRGERAFIRRHSRPEALAMLLDRYRRAGNFNRPWMLAVVYGRAALRMPPTGEARIWWEHAYPLAFRDLVEKHRKLGGAPRYYLYAIMRKESGFDPHEQSYANALGLLQMIPRTTRRVVKQLGLDYTPDLLFDPELNIETGAWYIGRLLAKFKGQIPYGAGSFNGGPRAIMKWMQKFSGQPADVWGELASYSQTRGYMKKVTETYARYLYLYEKKVYELPLAIDFDFEDNALTY